MKRFLFRVAIFIIFLNDCMTSYAQTVVVDSKNDTTICFTINQSRFLLKEHYRAELNDSLLAICSEQSSILNSIIENNKLVISTLMEKEENSNLIRANLTSVILDKDSENALLKKEVKRQKRHKNVAIGGGIALNLAVLYLALFTH